MLQSATMNQRSVIVIGAGMAGLSAAYEFEKAGWQATVLEARSRVGGRVFSVREFSNGLVAEGGGEFIDHHHFRMLGLAREFNLRLGEIANWHGQSGDWGAFGGKAGDLRDESIWGVNLENEFKKIWVAMAELSQFVSDPSSPLAASQAKQLDATPVSVWIHSQNVHPLARQMFVNQIRSEYTCEPEQFSLLDLARNAALYYSNPDDLQPVYRIIGGNDQLPHAIAERLNDVRKNAVVMSLLAQAEEVTVKYKQVDSFHTLRAPYVILAIPLTTVRMIDFEGSLPPAHQKMAAGLSYGAVTKVMIEYRKRFWKEYGWNGSLTTDLPIVLSWEATSHLEGERGILTAYTGGGPGMELSRLSDEERIRAAVSVIEKLFPGSSNLIETTRTIAWVNEPFTRGSYLAFAPGDISAHWQALFSPAGRLYFAGEHATVYQGYMEGAVESGQRAAREIIAKG